MTRDARVMYGLPASTSPDGVRQHWEFTEPGSPRVFVERDRQTGLIQDGRDVVARIEHERWIADCPECNGGIACAPDMPDAACLSCGHVYQAVFPKPADIGAAEAILAHRPLREQRNWFPAVHDVADLKVQNLERGDPIR